MRKRSKKTPKKSEGKKVYRVKWELAANFLLRGWQLLEVETDKKGKMMATLESK